MSATIPTLGLDAYLRQLPGRCQGCGYHVRSQGCHCNDVPVAPSPVALRDAGQQLGKVTPEEWSIFTAALAQVARGGIVHQNDVRPLIRGRIFHKHIGPCYTRAVAIGLLIPLGREDSGDTAGRNTHHSSGVYRLGVNTNRSAA